MQIRQYCSEDKEPVWLLHNLALEGTGAHAGNGPWDEDLHEISKTYLSTGGDFMVGIDDERLIAMGAIVKRNCETAEIKRMRVHPEHQRRGYGEQMLHALEKQAAFLGFEKLVLETTSVQVAAQALYEKNRFHLVQEWDEGEFHILRYEKYAQQGAASEPLARPAGL